MKISRDDIDSNDDSDSHDDCLGHVNIFENLVITVVLVSDKTCVNAFQN